MSMLFASRGGKNNAMQRQMAFSLLAADAYEHRKDSLNDAVCTVLFFNSATDRIVICSFSDGYAYAQEYYDAKEGWLLSDPGVRGFYTLSELRDYLSSVFFDVLLQELE